MARTSSTSTSLATADGPAKTGITGNLRVCHMLYTVHEVPLNKQSMQHATLISWGHSNPTPSWGKRKCHKDFHKDLHMKVVIWPDLEVKYALVGLQQYCLQSLTGNTNWIHLLQPRCVKNNNTLNSPQCRNCWPEPLSWPIHCTMQCLKDSQCQINHD